MLSFVVHALKNLIIHVYLLFSGMEKPPMPSDGSQPYPTAPPLSGPHYGDTPYPTGNPPYPTGNPPYPAGNPAYPPMGNMPYPPNNAPYPNQ